MILLLIGLVICFVLLFAGSLFSLLNCFFTFNLLLNCWGFSESIFIFDSVTVGILVMLFTCFCYVYFYTKHYFGVNSLEEWLNIIICMFVGVMILLVSTGDYMLTLIFWEYLGVVSFFLILFYCSNLSLRASIITLVSSRLGDVCLFLMLCVSCYFFNNVLFIPLIIFFFIMFTKSASFPFISWLLEAMRAPTPVSSLVHSSTLVAAGVWFVIRYDFLMFFNNCFCYVSILLLTIMITAICSLFYFDLKKIVALSTCNNIAWCLLYLIFGDLTLALYQLLSHGVAKCILFILIGDVMSGASGAQCSNCVYAPRLYNNWGIFSLFSVILGLSGAPFIGVFFTKHFLLTNFMFSNNIVLIFFLLMLVLLSYLYSFRLCNLLINTKSSVNLGVLYFFNSGMIVYIWLFINYFMFFSFDEKILLNSIISSSLIFFQLISIVIIYFGYNSTIISIWSSSLFGCDNLVELCYSSFSKIINIVNFMFYRWDNYILFVWDKVGSNSILNVYGNNMLNIVVLSILLFLACCCIVY
uniref:NADH:ubiquinone reductase (H(+)-translocating) n=1 Tax=Moniezia benedeni TaxID=218196 RepID=A0A2D0VPH2_9CEST|nr:NADH dehydrogenase subunit 5 [Moniezia benedeni]AOY40421.1 NADH dehydrogenase subunit 5 [Moniezia benedeni]